jgi:hypothetical protein
MSFGKIKYFAHRLIKGDAIPFFADNKINRRIEDHVSRILAARTRRRK